jgi:hypothetical protein
VTVVEEGHAVVYARESVKPDALADEAIHLIQLNDPRHPRLGESIRMLGEATLDQWGKFDVEARKNLFERKLEVEIDAKHRRMAELQPGDPEMTSAQDQLRDLEALQKKVQAIKPEELQAMKASGQMPDYLKDPAWLFSKTTTGRADPRTTPGVDISKLKRTPIHDSPAAKLKGAHVELVGQPWTETTTIVASNDGKVTFDPTNPHEITVGARRYVLEDGAQLNVKNGDVVKNGTLLATEPSEQYRLVEVTEGKGRPRERLEYYSKKRGQWVQAGEHSTRRGALVEKAGREQITRELDAELAAAKKSPNAQDPNRLVRYVRVQHQNARGQGFDDVVVEFRGNPPKAKIRIVEIKDYPGRYLQASQMSAIRENLHQNMKALRRSMRSNQRIDLLSSPRLGMRKSMRWATLWMRTSFRSSCTSLERHWSEVSHGPDPCSDNCGKNFEFLASLGRLPAASEKMCLRRRPRPSLRIASTAQPSQRARRLDNELDRTCRPLSKGSRSPHGRRPCSLYRAPSRNACAWCVASNRQRDRWCNARFHCVWTGLLAAEARAVACVCCGFSRNIPADGRRRIPAVDDAVRARGLGEFLPDPRLPDRG